MIEAMSKTVEIDGVTYEIQVLDAIKGFRLYVKLLNSAGGALADLGNLKTSSPGELAMRAMGAVLANVTPEFAEELRSTFAASCAVVLEGGKKPQVKDVFITHFRGRYAHMTKWILECAKANFADFLAGDSSESPLADLLTMFQSKSPRTSTGSSTDP